nr:hypothetical protein [Allomuricauda sp.]
MALSEDLILEKKNLIEFKEIAVRTINLVFESVEKDYKTKGNYRIYFSKSHNKFIRPINHNLFIFDSKEFEQKFNEVVYILGKIKGKEAVINNEEENLINSVFYTTQQALGCGFDLLIHPNSARKHVGNRFEELMRCVFSEIGISNKRIVLQVPYETEDGKTKMYKCENDLVISPYDEVKSSTKKIDEKEVVISVKTTSKDRMGKMFTDKLLLEKIQGYPQKFIGIFLNDVQRKESNNISYTLVSGQFMVYTNFLEPMEGVYYLDPPPNVLKAPFNKHMSTFAKLLTTDVWDILAS